MLDTLISDLISISSRILWRRTEGEEEDSDWGELCNALESIVPILSPEDRTYVLDTVNDFSRRLSVKMIGRP